MNMNTYPIKKYVSGSASLGLGFLAYLSLSQVYHFVHESGFDVVSFLIAVSVLVCGVGVGHVLSKHLSVCTHDHTDDVDITFILLLVVGSLVHTVFDGSVIHESFSSGIGEGVGVLFAILFHEIIRTTILYRIIRVMGFGTHMAFVSVFGVSIVGTIGGFILGGMISGYHEYEGVAHLISGGMFIAVTTDLYYYIKHHFGKINILFVVLGIVTAYVAGLFGGHEE